MGLLDIEKGLGLDTRSHMGKDRFFCLFNLATRTLKLKRSFLNCMARYEEGYVMTLKATARKVPPLSKSSLLFSPKWRNQDKHQLRIRYSPKHSLKLLLIIWVIHLDASLSLEGVSLTKDVSSKTLNIFITTEDYLV